MADYDKMRPTDRAKYMFSAAEAALSVARSWATTDGQKMDYSYLMIDSVSAIAKGMSDMATSIRATYLLLEKVDRRLDQIERSK